MATINKKIWPDSFEKILFGEKKFELRLADFDINEGDTLALQEWDPEKREYTGRQIEKKVTHILKWENEPPYYSPEEVQQYGLQILSLG